jgi:hypothetical protein
VVRFPVSPMGLGKKRGFEMQRILIAPHGGSKNDTLVTVEQKNSGPHSRRCIRAETMKPPIFAARPIGNAAQQYMHRARMFRDAAIKLPDYSSAEQYWPKYALLTHAIELALKSFRYAFREHGYVARSTTSQP